MDDLDAGREPDSPDVADRRVAFFLRRRGMARRAFLIASSVVAVVLMSWVVYVVVRHLDVLTSAPKEINDALVAVVPAVLVLGLVGGLVLRRVRPKTIALLARDASDVELSNGNDDTRGDDRS